MVALLTCPPGIRQQPGGSQRLIIKAYFPCLVIPLAATRADVVDFAFAVISLQRSQSPVRLPAKAGSQRE